MPYFPTLAVAPPLATTWRTKYPINQQDLLHTSSLTANIFSPRFPTPPAAARQSLVPRANESGTLEQENPVQLNALYSVGSIPNTGLSGSANRGATVTLVNGSGPSIACTTSSESSHCQQVELCESIMSNTRSNPQIQTNSSLSLLNSLAVRTPPETGLDMGLPKFPLPPDSNRELDASQISPDFFHISFPLFGSIFHQRPMQNVLQPQPKFNSTALEVQRNPMFAAAQFSCTQPPVPRMFLTPYPFRSPCPPPFGVPHVDQLNTLSNMAQLQSLTTIFSPQCTASKCTCPAQREHTLCPPPQLPAGTPSKRTKYANGSSKLKGTDRMKLNATPTTQHSTKTQRVTKALGVTPIRPQGATASASASANITNSFISASVEPTGPQMKRPLAYRTAPYVQTDGLRTEPHTTDQLQVQMPTNEVQVFQPISRGQSSWKSVL